MGRIEAELPAPPHQFGLAEFVARPVVLDRHPLDALLGLT
jgi:hypothetical protein